MPMSSKQKVDTDFGNIFMGHFLIFLRKSETWKKFDLINQCRVINTQWTVIKIVLCVGVMINVAWELSVFACGIQTFPLALTCHI